MRIVSSSNFPPPYGASVGSASGTSHTRSAISGPAVPVAKRRSGPSTIQHIAGEGRGAWSREGSVTRLEDTHHGEGRHGGGMAWELPDEAPGEIEAAGVRGPELHGIERPRKEHRAAPVALVDRCDAEVTPTWT